MYIRAVTSYRKLVNQIKLGYRFKWVCTRNYYSHVNNEKMEEEIYSPGGRSSASVWRYMFM